MRIGPAGNHRNNSGQAEFRALLDRPFHAVELEDRQQQGQVDRRWSRLNFFAEFEVDEAICYRDHDASSDDAVGDDVELLSDPCTEDANEVVSVSTGEGSSVARNLIGDPSAPGHGMRMRHLAALRGFAILN